MTEGRQDMSRQSDMMKYMGSIQQAAYIRPVMPTPARALCPRASEKNAILRFTAMVPKIGRAHV